MTSTTELPDIAAAFQHILQGVALDEQPLFIALAERMAAERYRAWAAGVSDADHQSGLLSCAAREEEIARRVESLYADAVSTQRKLLARHPALAGITQSLFAPCPLAQQFRLQAQGERLGAATWKAFAQQQRDAAAHDVLLSCAALEAENACFLESIASGTG